MTGKFRLNASVDNYAVVGNPVSHSKSPQIHSTFARQTHQDLHYQSILVEPGGFDGFLDEFQQQGGRGLNVTLPFKGDAWRTMDELTPRAARAESVNTISFSGDGKRMGETTDGCGLVRDLSNNDIELKNTRLLLLGAGGAIRGVLPDLIGSGPQNITIVNRTYSRAVDLVEKFSEISILNTVPLEELQGQQFDVVINGTAASLSGELLPVPDDILAGNAACYDMAYGDADTIFVQWAKAHGATVALDGLGMLVEQAAESFYIWRGVRPDTKPVIEMLRNKK